MIDSVLDSECNSSLSNNFLLTLIQCVHIYLFKTVDLL